MIGRALGILLQGVGYETRAIEDPAAGDPGELLEGIQLLLVFPTLSAGARESFLAGMRGRVDVPVLTLCTASKETFGHPAGCVPWPCRVEDLKEEIEAALLFRDPAAERAS